jgi:hypothetical protein
MLLFSGILETNVLLFWITSALATPCPQGDSYAHYEALVEQVSPANYGNVEQEEDLREWLATARSLRQSLNCMDGFLPIPEVVRFHVTQAVSADFFEYLPENHNFQNLNPGASTEDFFRAALLTDQNYDFRSDWAEAELNPALGEAFDRARSHLESPVFIKIPSGITVRVNGKRTDGWEPGVPTILQYKVAGRDIQTRYYGPSARPPDLFELTGLEEQATQSNFVQRAPIGEIVVRTPEVSRGPGIGEKMLWTTAVAGGLTSAGLYVLSVSLRAQYDDPSTPYDRLDTLREDTHRASRAAIGVGATSAGLAVSAIIAGVF